MSWKSNWANFWSANVARRFAGEESENKPQKAIRLELSALKIKRDRLYKKYLAKLDTQITDTNKLLAKNCKHPLKFVSVEHKEHDVGNEINYSRDYVGDYFYSKCSLCGAIDSQYYDKDDGWKDATLAKWQKEYDDQEKEAERKREAAEKEKRERSEFERLKSKYEKRA